MPLLWAHAEYLKLLRSTSDGQVFDRIRAVEERYARKGAHRHPRREVWKHGRRLSSLRSGSTLRVQATGEFVLHWSRDGWGSVEDTASTDVGVGLGYVDLPIPRGSKGPICFTFFWPSRNAWEGRDYRVDVRPDP
jgi:glucoamylase